MLELLPSTCEALGSSPTHTQLSPQTKDFDFLFCFIFSKPKVFDKEGLLAGYYLNIGALCKIKIEHNIVKEFENF